MTQTTPKTMQAAALDRFGGPETIGMQTLPVPEVGPDEVLITVESAGVAVWDPMEREGEFAKMFGIEAKFPYVLGSDGAGTVAAIGGQVSQFKVGDQVYASVLTNPKGGFYAEYVVVKAVNVSLIPSNLTIEQAGVFASDAMTGLRGMDDMLGLKPDETLMIFGASGGIGHLAVQLAKRMGARVLAVASGDDGVALAKQLGADAVVNGRKEDVAAAAREFAPNGIDAALVTAGGEAADRALKAVREGGRATYPEGVMPVPNVPPGVRLSTFSVELNQQALQRVNRLIEAGPFHVHIAQTFTFDKAADAHRTLDSHFLGKLALRPR